MHILKHEILVNPLFYRNEKYMSKSLTSLFVNTDHLVQLGQIADVNDTDIATEMWRAHDRYLEAQWNEHRNDFAAWAEEASAQLREQVEWSIREVEGLPRITPRPSTPAIKPIVHKSVAGCQLTSVAMSREQAERFAFLGGYYGKVLGALTEEAHAAHIQAEMLDDPATFEVRRMAAEVRHRALAERLLANTMRIA